MFKPIVVNVNIAFPALDNLVAFLVGEEQKKIDAATATLQAATLRLRLSGNTLQKAIDQTKEQ